jgi:hypothetical protein
MMRRLSPDIDIFARSTLRLSWTVRTEAAREGQLLGRRERQSELDATPPNSRPLYGIARAGRALAIGSGKLLTLGHDQWMYLLRRWFRLPGSVSASSPGLRKR